MDPTDTIHRPALLRHALAGLVMGTVAWHTGWLIGWLMQEGLPAYLGAQ